LQRWYTRFPHGLPAIGLLVLRIAIGAKLLLESFSCLLGPHGINLGIATVAALTGGLGACFVLGFLTPLVAGISAMGWTAVYLWHPAWATTLSDLTSVEFIAVAIALALLGPGAISLDAYFFGRRKIVIARVARP
jgi:uncharacterized membrane protein YphA (DoxX/SURF4 family)